MVVKVAINGYGTIGKRVADAVSRQDDMAVVGITKTRPTYEARIALQKGFDLYVAVPENIPQFEAAGMKVSGTLKDLLGREVYSQLTPTYYARRKIKRQIGIEFIRCSRVSIR